MITAETRGTEQQLLKILIMTKRVIECPNVLSIKTIEINNPIPNEMYTTMHQDVVE
jgi:hypothetical protein